MSIQLVTTTRQVLRGQQRTRLGLGGFEGM